MKKNLAPGKTRISQVKKAIEQLLTATKNLSNTIMQLDEISLDQLSRVEFPAYLDMFDLPFDKPFKKN